MIMNPCDNCRYYNFAKGVWETLPEHWVHVALASWVGVGFADATAVNRGVQHYIDRFKAVIVGGSPEAEPEIVLSGCAAIGVGGYHSDHFADPDDGVCQWCGVTCH
jgi:hypothetical protein